MNTECNQRSFGFHPHFRRQIVGRFDGGEITSDGGALLLREVEERTSLVKQFAGCFSDGRDPSRVEHTVEELVSQRVNALALGYEDLNDHDQLRRDTLLAVLAGKEDVSGESRLRERDRGNPLAGKSTLNRLELAEEEVSPRERYKKITVDQQAVDQFLVDAFLQAHDRPPEEIVLDLDATDDPLHGKQEGRFFHGYYKAYCYLPLYIFCGEFLLCARLRPSNIDAAAGSVEEIARIIEQIRDKWPEVRIVIRADSGFCREELMAWCEANGIHYVLGLAKNARLRRLIEKQQLKARRLFEETGCAARVFKECRYRTLKTWSRKRRVVAKAEHLEKGSNPRFVVTSFVRKRIEARKLYEEVYCARGDMENRIKEQQLYLFADRTSAATIRANQLRLWFSSVAYMLLQALRRLGLKGTSLSKAQCHTIRLKLLKIGAQIRVTVRKIWISLASSYPYAEIFAQVYSNLRRAAPLRC